MTGKSENSEKTSLQGQHLLADLFGVDDARLNDPASLAGVLKQMAAAAHLSQLAEPLIVATGPQGCSAALILKDAHISLHSYPESNYLAIDIFTFGNIDPEPMFAVLTETFSSQML